MSEQGRYANGPQIAPVSSGAGAWIETIAITAAVAALGYWYEPLDPLGAFVGFPWALFAPLLLSLRYGFINGLVSALLLLALLTWLQRIGYGDYHEIPIAYWVGLLSVSMISGEFRDLWGRRLEGLQRANDYRQMRLDEFTRAHHILRISHDRLEQRLAGSDQSLRSVLLAMRKRLNGLALNEDPLESMAEVILDLFGHYGPLRQASLYRVQDGKMEGPALAVLGDMEVIDAQDPLVLLTLERGELISIRPELVEQGVVIAGSKLLAGIPLLDTAGGVHGLVVVGHMPFFAFNDRNLSLLAILGGHVADLLARDERSALQFDEDKQHFLRMCQRSLLDASRYRVPACVLGIELKDPAFSRDIAQLLQSQQRALDVLQSTRNRRNSDLVLVLLPLTTEQGLAGYLERIRRSIMESLGVTLEAAGVEIFQLQVEGRFAARRLQQFLAEECGLDDLQLAVR